MTHCVHLPMIQMLIIVKKVLYGRSVFYMLLLGLLESERPSLRTMEDIFNSRRFKFLFNIHQNVSVKYNSISERLSCL